MTNELTIIQYLDSLVKREMWSGVKDLALYIADFAMDKEVE